MFFGFSTLKNMTTVTDVQLLGERERAHLVQLGRTVCILYVCMYVCTCMYVGVYVFVRRAVSVCQIPLISKNVLST